MLQKIISLEIVHISDESSIELKMFSYICFE